MDGQDVLHNFDPITDFSKYKTYKWIEIKGNECRDPEAGNQIKAAVDAELSKKGLVKRDTDPVDLYVGYQFALTAQTGHHTYEDSWEPGADWQDGWAGRGQKDKVTVNENHLHRPISTRYVRNHTQNTGVAERRKQDY